MIESIGRKVKQQTSWKKNISYVLIGFAIVFILYLILKGFVIPEQRACKTACTDTNPCTDEICDETTNYECVHKPKEECFCDDFDSCTTDTYNPIKGRCERTLIKPCCGNDICEPEEYFTCFSDCNPTEEEIALHIFDTNAIELNDKRQIVGYISVEVNKIGVMTLSSREKKYIRVDIIVQNIGQEKISYYYPNPVILGKKNNQLEDAYILPYDYEDVFEIGKEIYPEVIKKGAIFFEIKDSDSLEVNELIISSGLSDYNKGARVIGTGVLLYNRDYVFKFDLSNIQLKEF